MPWIRRALDPRYGTVIVRLARPARRRGRSRISQARRPPCDAGGEVRAGALVARQRRRRDLRHAERLPVELDLGADGRCVAVLLAQLVAGGLPDEERDARLIAAESTCADTGVAAEARAASSCRRRSCSTASAAPSVRARSCEHLERRAAAARSARRRGSRPRALAVDGRTLHRERGRRAAADRPLERLAHDLVQRRLRPLAERLRCGDVDVEGDPVARCASLGERVERRRRSRGRAGRPARG